MCKCMFKILTYSSHSANINLPEVSSYVDIVKVNVSAKLTNISKCSANKMKKINLCIYIYNYVGQ